MNTNYIQESNILPAGCYWIGDLCYVFPDKGPMGNYWDKIIEKNDCFTKGQLTEFDEGKIKIWADDTAFGDGVYPSNINFNFPVDAGLLGIIPEETVEYLNTIDGDYDNSHLKGLGIFVDFKEDFTIEMSNGRFRFGHVIIETDDDNSDDFSDLF